MISAFILLIISIIFLVSDKLIIGIIIFITSAALFLIKHRGRRVETFIVGRTRINSPKNDNNENHNEKEIITPLPLPSFRPLKNYSLNEMRER